MIVRLATTARNACVDAIAALLDAGASGGTLKIYSGSMPANPQTAPGGGNTLLGTLTFGDPALDPAASGTADFNAITDDAAADADGTAAWARLADSNGNAVMDVDVTDTGGGGVIELNTVDLVAGGPIVITGGSLTMPAS